MPCSDRRRAGDHDRDGLDDHGRRGHLALDGRRHVLPARRRTRPHHAERGARGAERGVAGPDRHRDLDEQLFREVGATLGVAVFGTLFTSRLADNLGGALAANADEAVQAGITSPDTLVPSAVQAAGEPLRSAIVDAYANSLAPVFWYLVPILAVAFLLALALKEIPLSEFAGMVARGEAVESEEDLARLSEPAPVDKVVILDDRDDDAREAPV